jgi:hypothetical protein
MNAANLDGKALYGILLLVTIHSGGLILSAILNNFYVQIVPYEYLPWTRLLVVIAEIVLITHFFERLKGKVGILENRKAMTRFLILTVVLLIGSQFRGYLDDSGPFLCGFALIDGTADLIFEIHETQRSYVSLVETFALGIALLLFGIRNLKVLS